MLLLIRLSGSQLLQFDQLPNNKHYFCCVLLIKTINQSMKYTERQIKLAPPIFTN